MNFVHYRGQPEAGTGHKMLSVPFVFSMYRFQGPAFRCDKIVVIVTLLEAIEGIPDKKFFFFGHRSLMRNSTQTAVTNMTIKRMLENKII